MKLKNNIMRRFAPAFIFFTLLFTLHASRLFAASVWTETTDADFSDGIFNMTITSGTGTAAQLTLSPFGNGADGSVTISATKNINTDIISSGRVTYADGINYAVTGVWTSSITCSAAPNGIVTGDEIILINQQGDGTNYGNVGNYEFFRVAGISGNFIIFTSSITKIYGATTSNNVLTGQKITAQRVPNWGNVTISGAGVSLTCTAWDGTKGGMVVFRSTGTVSVGSGASVSASGKGYRGSPQYVSAADYVYGFIGESASVGYQTVRQQSGGGSGGGAGCGQAGGGGGGYGASGSDGVASGCYLPGGAGIGGITIGSADIYTLRFGGSGGSSGSHNGGDRNGATGGSSGGILVIFASSITNSGTLSNNGAGGQNGYQTVPNQQPMGGGGGGAGGAIFLIANTITLGNTTATGGNGGTSATYTDCTPSGAGGNGGSGRICLGYPAGGLTGTTNPTHFAGTFPSGFLTGQTTGTYRSNVLNTASSDTRVSTITWNPSSQPGSTALVVAARASNTSFAASDAAPAWTAVANNTDANLSGQYIQYTATFTTTNSTTTPRLEDITILYCVKPNGLNWGNVFVTSMTINWTDTTSNPAGTIYTAQISTASNFTGTLFSSSTAKSVSSATVSGLSVNATYYARVVAGPTTGNIAATNLSPTWKATLCNAPTNMTLASPSQNQIQLNWEANGNPTGTKYIAHCSSDNFANIFSSTITATSTSFASLARNKKYSVRVYAANHDGVASGYLGPNDWRTKPGAFQSESAQSQPARTGANAFGFVGDAVWEWEVPVKSGSALTITAYIRYNSEYGGSATKPKLTLSGKGISPTSISATSSAENAWELLTINAGTPSQNAILTLRAEGFSVNPNAKFYIDDISVGQ